MKRLMIYTVHQCYSNDEVKKNEMDGACSVHGVEERCIEGFGGDT
jgi:hypothetical protein